MELKRDVYRNMDVTARADLKRTKKHYNQNGKSAMNEIRIVVLTQQIGDISDA